MIEVVSRILIAMLPELKDADLDHPDYKAAGGSVVSTRKQFEQ
jgi:hypothetical protein